MGDNVQYELGRLGEAVTNLADEIKRGEEIREARFAQIMTSFKEGDTRISSLEKWRAWTAGVGMVLLLFVAGAAGWIRLFRGSGPPPT